MTLPLKSGVNTIKIPLKPLSDQSCGRKRRFSSLNSVCFWLFWQCFFCSRIAQATYLFVVKPQCKKYSNLLTWVSDKSFQGTDVNRTFHSAKKRPLENFSYSLFLSTRVTFEMLLRNIILISNGSIQSMELKLTFKKYNFNK